MADAVKASANSSYGSAALSIATNTCVLTGDLVCALERAADGTAFDVDDIDLDDSSEGRSSKRSKLGEDSSKDDSKKDKMSVFPISLSLCPLLTPQSPRKSKSNTNFSAFFKIK